MPIPDKTRLSFFRAFGITPGEQRALERWTPTWDLSAPSHQANGWADIRDDIAAPRWYHVLTEKTNP